MVGSFVEDFSARGWCPAGSGGGGASVTGLSAPPGSRAFGPDPALLPAPVTESPVPTSVARSAGIEGLRPRSGVGGHRRRRRSCHEGTWPGLERQASILITGTLRAPVLNMAWWGSPTPQGHRLLAALTPPQGAGCSGGWPLRRAPPGGGCGPGLWPVRGPASSLGRLFGHRCRPLRRVPPGGRGRAVLPWPMLRPRPTSGPGAEVRLAFGSTGCGPGGRGFGGC